MGKRKEMDYENCFERKIIVTHFWSSTQMNCFSASTWQTATLLVTSGSRFTVNGTCIFLFLFADERMLEKEGICEGLG